MCGGPPTLACSALQGCVAADDPNEWFGHLLLWALKNPGIALVLALLHNHCLALLLSMLVHAHNSLLTQSGHRIAMSQKSPRGGGGVQLFAVAGTSRSQGRGPLTHTQAPAVAVHSYGALLWS